MMQPSIHFHGEDVSLRLRKIKSIREWLQKAILSEGLQPGTIQYVWCSDAYLLRINQEYLQHDDLTDIITFDYGEADTLSGDIFISIERVKENAATFKTSFTNELQRVMIHGVLHLCGYKDKSPAEQREMTEKEDYYLSLRAF